MHSGLDLKVVAVKSTKPLCNSRLYNTQYVSSKNSKTGSIIFVRSAIWNHLQMVRIV